MNEKAGWQSAQDAEGVVDRADWARRRLCQALAIAAACPRLAGANEGEIVVGQIGPFTGTPGPDARELNQGMRACFAALNERGGIGGRKVSLFDIDDGFTAEGFARAFSQAMQRKPVALLSPVGSAAVKRLLDDRLLDGADLLVLNAVPGAEAFRHPGHSKLFHIRSGDRQQIEKIVGHAATLGVDRLAVLHQDSVLGVSGLEMARAAAQPQKLKVEPILASADATSLTTAATQISKSGVKAALVLGAPSFMVNGIAKLRAASSTLLVFALSYAPVGLVAKAAGNGSRGVGLAQNYPNPLGVSLPVQREFQAAMKQSFPDVSGYTSSHLEGYITARVFAEAARRSRDATPAGLMRALRATEYDLGGFRVNFSRDNLGSGYVDIGVINETGRLVY